MTAETSYAASPRAAQWVNLSENHRLACERLEQNLIAFRDGRPAKFLNIVGPYGSGKSELMTWGFHFAWVELGLPAIFVNLETLLDAIPPDLGPTHLVSAIQEFLSSQLHQIAEHLELTPRPDGVHLSTDVRYHESFLSYFRDLFDASDLSPDRLRVVLASSKVVLFLDEIEQKYATLMERVPADDRAPFREVFQAVDQGRVPYYMVGSFGLTSAYESVSDADMRREGTIILPIPDTSKLDGLGETVQFRNFIWWASRGRPGWARKLAREWGPHLGAIERMEGLVNLGPPTIDTLPIVDANTLGDLFTNSRQNRALTTLLLLLRPLPLDQVPGYQPGDSDLSGLLGRHRFVIAPYDDLISVDTFCDAIQTDLQQIAAAVSMQGLNWQLLGNYLRMLARAVADDEERIVFGGWRDQDEWAVKAVIVPLLIILQDLLLEFEGDRSDTISLLGLIDRIFERCKVIGDHIEDPYAVAEAFSETLNHYHVARNPRDSFVVAPSLLTLDNLFPRMVGRPLLLLHPDARGSIGEQRVYVDGNAGRDGNILGATFHRDGIEIQCLFVPDSRSLQRLQSRAFERSNRNDYLAHDRIYILMPLAENQGRLALNFEDNSDLRVLERMRKIQWNPIGERRTQDFGSLRVAVETPRYRDCIVGGHDGEWPGVDWSQKRKVPNATAAIYLDPARYPRCARPSNRSHGCG